MSQKKILIAANHFLLGEGLTSFVNRTDGLTCCGTMVCKDDLVAFVENNPIDLVILDFESMDFENPREVSALKGNNPDLRLLILANGLIHQLLSSFTAAGFKNIVSRLADEEELLLAIEKTILGKQYYSESILELLLEKSSKPMVESNFLTSTEIDIVKLIAEGLTTKEIALKKHISYHTVMTHRKNIFRKLKVTNVSELMLHAIKSGWIDNIEYYI